MKLKDQGTTRKTVRRISVQSHRSVYLNLAGREITLHEHNQLRPLRAAIARQDIAEIQRLKRQFPWATK